MESFFDNDTELIFLRAEGARNIQWMFGYQLSHLKGFLEQLGNLIDEERKKEIRSIQNTADALAEADWADKYPIHWDDWAGRLREAFIIALMTTTEVQLQNICALVRKAGERKLGQHDFTGGHIKSAQKFICEHVGLLQPPETLWAQLAEIYQLRNLLVHCAGHLPSAKAGAKKPVNSLIRRKKGIVEGEHGFLAMDQAFCQYAAETVSKFFTQLHGSYDKMCKAINKGKGAEARTRAIDAVQEARGEPRANDKEQGDR